MRHSMKSGRRGVMLAAVASSACIVLAACGSSSGGTTSNSPSSSGSTKSSYSIAVLLASSNNGYNQAVSQGVSDAVKEIGGNITTTVFDGGFNSDTQLSQLETAGTGNKFDGVVIVPNDGVSIAAAFPLANKIPVATVLFPIGPNISDMQPQVDGVVTTVSVDPATAAANQAQGVVTYCQNINPCNVVLLLGFLNTPNDVARQKAYEGVLAPHSNIKIVATAEGKYDPAASSTAIANVLQAHPDVKVILSNADQEAKGAQIALEDAKIDPASIYIAGAGGTTYGVENVRNGTWKADYINFPVSMGNAAMKQLYASLTGGSVEKWVDADKVGKVEAYATKETLAQSPDFKGEWAG